MVSHMVESCVDGPMNQWTWKGLLAEERGDFGVVLDCTTVTGKKEVSRGYINNGKAWEK